ncbi:MAG: hypothetical protein H7346_12535 [Burkholderiaceae bacterium]|nr:hypothetical protein [Burkholderiaceae bacterium]
MTTHSEHNANHRLKVRAHAVSAAMLLGLFALADARAQEAGNACGPVTIPGHYGPYDYVSERGKLPIVEQFHFTPKVEALVAGQSGSVGGDISYTLNASPNHHRALVALMRLGARTKSLQPPGATLSIECFFDRAIRFRPKDTVVRTLFGLYLAQIQHMPEAMRQLEAATILAGDDGFAQFNIGLAYFDLEQFDHALRHAHSVMKMGLQPTLLIDKLKSANRWKEPAE